MNLRINSSIFLLLAFPALIHGRADPKKIHYAAENGRNDEWIVVMKPPTETATAGGGLRTSQNFDFSTFTAAESSANAIAAFAGENVQVNQVFSESVQGFAGAMSAKAAEKLAELDSVAYVEQNADIRLTDATWGIDRVDQRDLPLDNSFSPDGTGSDVYAYIIDTGVQTSHNEFGNRATWGINTSGDGEDRDCHGHGTHVAGTVGGSQYGVAKDVNIVAVKVLTCSGSGSTAGVIAGVEWAMADAVGKKATANLSLGGGYSTAMNTAVKNLQDSGVPTVVAAGNDNGNACTKSPASEPAVITVGSTTSNDARSSFSNYGTCLDIFAPGSGITAAWIGSDSATNTISGTSMASPHVCGGAALLLEQGMTGEQVTAELLSRATPDKVTNAQTGSPNKLLYVGAVGPTSPPTPAPPTPAPTPCIQNDFELTLVTDNYPGETAWTLVNKCTDETASSGGSYGSAGSTYVETECIPSGQYEFTISDSYGDGICCSYGSGSYTVKYNGELVKQGGEFGSSESTLFGTCGSTDAPIAPTAAPVAPTAAPVAPTAAPVAPTAAPVAPTAAPVAQPAVGDDWETIYSDNFETGQGRFMGTNKRFNHFSMEGGDWSLRLRKTSVLKTQWINVEDFSEVALTFWMYGKGMEVGDNFFLRARFNGESSWTVVDEYTKGTDFENTEWLDQYAILDVPEGKKKIQIQFKGDSDKGNDRVYIDNVLLEGNPL